MRDQRKGQLKPTHLSRTVLTAKLSMNGEAICKYCEVFYIRVFITHELEF